MDDNNITAIVERLTSEGFISMRDAANLYRRGTHKSTPTRHALDGFKRSDGTVVKLEAVRVGGSLCTSRAAVLRFFVAQNASTPVANQVSATPAKRTRAQAAASAELGALLGAN